MVWVGFIAASLVCLSLYFEDAPKAPRRGSGVFPISPGQGGLRFLRAEDSRTPSAKVPPAAINKCPLAAAPAPHHERLSSHFMIVNSSGQIVSETVHDHEVCRR